MALGGDWPSGTPACRSWASPGLVPCRLVAARRRHETKPGLGEREGRGAGSGDDAFWQRRLWFHMCMHVRVGVGISAIIVSSIHTKMEPAANQQQWEGRESCKSSVLRSQHHPEGGSAQVPALLACVFQHVATSRSLSDPTLMREQRNSVAGCDPPTAAPRRATSAHTTNSSPLRRLQCGERAAGLYPSPTPLHTPGARQSPCQVETRLRRSGSDLKGTLSGHPRLTP